MVVTVTELVSEVLEPEKMLQQSWKMQCIHFELEITVVVAEELEVAVEASMGVAQE